MGWSLCGVFDYIKAPGPASNISPCVHVYFSGFPLSNLYLRWSTKSSHAVSLTGARPFSFTKHGFTIYREGEL